jgi:hypothetical protein
VEREYAEYRQFSSSLAEGLVKGTFCFFSYFFAFLPVPLHFEVQVVTGRIQ